MQVWGKTDIGKVRHINQDNFFCEVVLDEVMIFCVCDGMGGTNGGHIASKYASREFIHEVREKARDFITDNEAKDILKSAVNCANAFVYEMSTCDTNLSEMGTTLVGGFLIKDKIYIINVGDSRCYHINNDEIIQVTKDHSLVQDLVDKGEIKENEKGKHPQKNYITRAVGVAKDINADIYKITLEKDEFLLLCSDGLYDLISNDEMKKVVLSDMNINEKCDELIKIANENGGLDNITAIILEF